ncbi:MAG: hypothetical protein KBG48_07915 [Kofleriaceae bacterium]|jgi:hypothetical protein|nr:hypothetical protein [Kofleriaceae bacterium]MBP9167296.1 hypothetical protein [Kofleriaceae bacterium]
MLSSRRFADVPWSSDPWRWFATTPSGDLVPFVLQVGTIVDAVLRAGVIAVLAPPDPAIRNSGHYIFVLDARSGHTRCSAIPVPSAFNDFDLTLTGEALGIVTGSGRDSEFGGTQYRDCELHVVDPSTGATRIVAPMEEGVPRWLEGEDETFLVWVTDVDGREWTRRCHLDGTFSLFADTWLDRVAARRGRVQSVEAGPHERWVRLSGPSQSCSVPRALPRVPREVVATRLVGAASSLELRPEAAILVTDAGKEICRLENPTDVTPVFSPSGRWLMLASESVIQVLDATTGAPQHTWTTSASMRSMRSMRSMPNEREADGLKVPGGLCAASWATDQHLVCAFATGLVVGDVATGAATVWRGDLTWVDQLELRDDSTVIELRGSSILRVAVAYLTGEGVNESVVERRLTATTAALAEVEGASS